MSRSNRWSSFILSFWQFAVIRILLADDHAVMRRHLRRLLEDGGHCTVCAEACCGEEAVSCAASCAAPERPDVAVLDLKMGEMNGLEAALRIRALVPGIKIVIVSMDHAGDVAELAQETGVDDWVVKDAALHSLLPTVLRVCHALKDAARRA
jgi:DNA-binding NarL/FixJ family response regulator